MRAEVVSRARLVHRRRLLRFHGTLKDEEVCWNLSDSLEDACCSLTLYRECYNLIRPHWGTSTGPRQASGAD